MATHSALHPYGFLASPGEMGQRIQAYDWSRTPLGPIDQWPQSLKTSVSLMLNSQQPMWIGWGPEVTFLYNDAYVHVLSLAKHPGALGRPTAEVWREIWDVCGPLVQKVFDKGEATFVDDVLLFMDRGSFTEETYYAFSYSPIRDEFGKVGGLFCPNNDVTPKHLNARRLRTLSDVAANALAEKTTKAVCAAIIDTLAQNSADLPFALLYLVDADNRHAVLEQGTLPLPMSSFPLRIALDKPLSERDWPFSAVFETMQPQTVSVAGIEGLPPGLANQRIQQAVTLPIIAPAQKRPIGFLIAGVNPTRPLDAEYAFFFDLLAGQVATAIQGARTAESEKRRADMLAQLDQAKTVFFSNVSHEFRTPLTLMLGPLSDALVDQAHPLPAPQHERFELVRRNALRLQKLVNSLLDFSRIQAGRANARFCQVDLPELTLDLASSFRSAIEKAGLRLVVDCPPMAEAVYVDPSMWEKILMNLLSNAFKFTFEGEIRVTLRSLGSQVSLSVADTGVGIPPQELPRVFERFHRIEGARARTHEGSGIGLALVRDLVELHGGGIHVESESGRGTAFTLTLPTGCAHLPAEQVSSAADGKDRPAAAESFVAEAERWLPEAESGAVAPIDGFPASASAPVKPKRSYVLVVDDNADMRDYLRRLLQPHWDIGTADNGRQALDSIQRRLPDMVISDVMMPILDGFGLLAALRENDMTKGLPVMLLSARAGEEARIEGLQAGADAYLVKPFAGRELVAKVEALLLRAQIRSVETSHARRMEAIFAQAPVAIAILRGPEHVYELANPSYMALVANRSVLGRPIRSALAELEGQGIYELLDQVYRSGQPYIGRSLRVELIRGGAAPEECFFDFVYQPLLDQDGRVEGIAVVAFEVTELAQARREAEVANTAKDEFLAMLGHELRNPLAPIMTALQLMRLRGVEAAEKERAIIERQATHLIRLVDDLLDVSRVARGKIQLRKAPTEIAVIVAKAIETVSPVLDERRHKLTVDVPTQGLMVDADLERLTQVIANLLTNAAKYTEQGGHVQVRAARENAEVKIDVSDTGIGIAPDTLPYIFDMFVQERQAPDRSRGGLGLGLAIVRNLTRLHGGSVTAASDGLQKGSTFTVRFPLIEPRSMPAEPLLIASSSPAMPARKIDEGYALLIVDDNEDAARLLGESLSLYGHQVRTAVDGPSALEMMKTFMPEIALLDIGLPGMDGFELAALLKKLPGMEHLCLVAVTGYGQDADRKDTADAGFSLHIVKPVDVEYLNDQLLNLMKRKGIEPSPLAKGRLA